MLNGLFVVVAGLAPAGRQESPGWQAPVVVKRIVTFILVCSTWVFFRAHSVGDAFTIFKRLFPLRPGEVVEALGRGPLIAALILVTFSMAIQVARERYRVRELISRQPVWLRWSIYTAALTRILLFGEFHSRDFIYFRF